MNANVGMAEDRAHRVVTRNQDVNLDMGLGNYTLMITWKETNHLHIHLSKSIIGECLCVSSGVFSLILVLISLGDSIVN